MLQIYQDQDGAAPVRQELSLALHNAAHNADTGGFVYDTRRLSAYGVKKTQGSSFEMVNEEVFNPIVLYCDSVLQTGGYILADHSGTGTFDLPFKNLSYCIEQVKCFFDSFPVGCCTPPYFLIDVSGVVNYNVGLFDIDGNFLEFDGLGRVCINFREDCRMEHPMSVHKLKRCTFSGKISVDVPDDWTTYSVFSDCQSCAFVSLDCSVRGVGRAAVGCPHSLFFNSSISSERGIAVYDSNFCFGYLSTFTSQREVGISQMDGSAFTLCNIDGVPCGVGEGGGYFKDCTGTYCWDEAQGFLENL